MTAPSGPAHHDLTAPLEPSGSSGAEQGWRHAVDELLGRIAEERNIDFEPVPAALIEVLPDLVRAVEGAANGMTAQERRWLAAALAALSQHVQLYALPDPLRSR